MVAISGVGGNLLTLRRIRAEIDGSREIPEGLSFASLEVIESVTESKDIARIVGRGFDDLLEEVGGGGVILYIHICESSTPRERAPDVLFEDCEINLAEAFGLSPRHGHRGLQLLKSN